ncbi:MAG: hypothetical protein HC808_20405 [Candidatus Competibacteraceae bacterium]|nr:hypothetical protein [Candidatus Competibacteraceae bacterium]
MRNLRIVAIGCLLALFHAGANAASISLSSPSADPIAINGFVAFDITMDFSDEATLGGGFDIIYNGAVLDYVSFTFNALASFPRDPGFDSTISDLAGKVQDIGFGNFAGLSGPYTIGTIIFQGIGAGTSGLTLGNTTGASGPFISNVTFEAMTVDYAGGSVTVEAAVVPLPAALLLAAPVLLTLGGLRRQAA